MTVKNGKLADAISAQVLLETGNKMLQESRSEIEEINNKLSGEQHQPNESDT